MINPTRIVILINPLSPKSKEVSLHVISELQTRCITFESFSVDWPENLFYYSDVWLIGGDGTVNYFINKYPESDIPVSIFKGGTGNDFSRRLYGNISVADQVNLVLRAAVQKVDLGKCNGQLYANSLGIGFDGEVLKSMKTVRRFGGHFGYLLVVIKKIFSFREMYFTITSDNKYQGKYLLVIINNSSHTGGGFMVTPKASLTDSKLDMVLCNPLSIMRRLRYLPVIEKGNHLGRPFINYTQTDSVHVECECETFAQIDGELIAAKSFLIDVCPGRLSVKY